MPWWIYAVIVSASMAASVYALTAVTWWQRRAWALAALNLVTTVFFTFLVGAHIRLVLQVPPRPPDPEFLVMVLPYVFGVPALARFAELRREERRRAFAVEFTRDLEGR